MADLRKLKHDALEAAGTGNWRKAAWCYANLEKDEPRDPTWSLKLGESLRRLGNDVEAVKAFSRAANGYAKDDLLIKAIAVCKIILGIEPKHTQTQEMLAALYASQKQPAAPPVPLPKRTPPPTTAPTAFPSVTEMCTAPTPPSAPFAVSPPIPAATPKPAGTAPAILTKTQPPLPSATSAVLPASPAMPAAPAAPPPLRQLRLAALVPGSRQSQNIPASGSSAAMEIPVDEEFASERGPMAGPHKGAGRRTMATFVLPKTPFFSVLTPALMRMAIERVRLIQLPAGEVLFSQGDSGDDLFVVAWGEVAVLVPQEVARLSEGEFFGEIALLADQPRTATVRATVDSQVLAFDRALLGDLVAASPDLLVVLLRFLRERLIATLAETSPLFAPFTALERLALAARFHFLEIDEGLRIIEEGGKSAGLFVLLAGEVQAVADHQTVVRLLPGEAFGEISLITGQPSTAQVTAMCKCFLLFLPRADFTEIIMTHPQVLEYLGSLVEARARAIGRLDIL
jgi:CRP-like cAMP-binding protein